MTPLDAAQTIYDVLAIDDIGTPADGLTELVNKVYLVEPRAGLLATPVAATISVDGETPFEFQATVRVYGQLGQLNAYNLQRQVIAAWTVIEDLLNDQSIWARGSWSNTYFPDLDAFIAECPMIASRTDF